MKTQQIKDEHHDEVECLKNENLKLRKQASGYLKAVIFILTAFIIPLMFFLYKESEMDINQIGAPVTILFVAIVVSIVVVSKKTGGVNRSIYR